MQRRHVTQAIAALGSAVALTPNSVLSQSDKTLKILLGFPAGGSSDVLARLLAEGLKDELRQNVIVDNKPGAGGRLAAELFKNVPPDGSTVMITPVVVPVLAPLVFSKLNYDPKTDLVPVVLLTNFNFAIGVRADSELKNLSDLIAWCKANPQKAAYGTPGAGSLPHFFGLQVGKAAGVDIIHVPFAGGGPMQIALLGDQVPAGIDVEQEFLQSVKTGKIRILATSTAKRTKVYPDVPTFAEQGMPSVQGSGWFALFAPRGTAGAEIERVNRAANKVLAKPGLAARLLGMGLEVAGGSAADLQKALDDDTARWAPVVKASGFKVD